jgi:hypothetical protein
MRTADHDLQLGNQTVDSPEPITDLDQIRTAERLIAEDSGSQDVVMMNLVRLD